LFLLKITLFRNCKMSEDTIIYIHIWYDISHNSSLAIFYIYMDLLSILCIHKNYLMS
jgi:hypothetical protein